MTAGFKSESPAGFVGIRSSGSRPRREGPAAPSSRGNRRSWVVSGLWRKGAVRPPVGRDGKRVQAPMRCIPLHTYGLARRAPAPCDARHSMPSWRQCRPEASRKRSAPSRDAFDAAVVRHGDRPHHALPARPILYRHAAGRTAPGSSTAMHRNRRVVPQTTPDLRRCPGRRALRNLARADFGDITAPTRPNKTPLPLARALGLCPLPRSMSGQSRASSVVPSPSNSRCVGLSISSAV